MIDVIMLGLVAIVAIALSLSVIKAIVSVRYCKDKTLEDFKLEEIIDYVYSNPQTRKSILKRLEAEAKDIIAKTIIIALQQALELPSFNYFTLMVFLGGVGLGIGIGMIISNFLLK